MTPVGDTTTRLDSLTGVRFFAAFLVFGFHSVGYAKNGEMDFFAAGMVGVSLFYIISGFVMSWTDRPQDTALGFYRRRFARIYPAFIVAWLLSLLISLAQHKIALVDVIVPPTLLQAWVPIEAFYFAGEAVFWSLSCEAFFYIMYPVLAKLIRRLADRGLVAVMTIAGVVSLSVAVAALGMPENPTTRWLLIIFPPLRLMEFVIGMCLGLLFRRGRRLPIPLWAAVPLAALAVAAASVAPYSLSRYAVTLIPFILLVASLASADLMSRRSFFRTRPIVALGVWSYCFYLLHTMVLGAVFFTARWLGVRTDDAGTPSIIFITFSALVASAISAWLLHICVERPMERRLRGSSAPRLDDDSGPKDR